MKVICIDSKTRFLPVPELEEGAVYEVASDNGCGDGCCYSIYGLPSNYKKDRFIPCSNIDERELVNELLETKTNAI